LIPDTVTNPGTNRARRQLTSLIKNKALRLRQTAMFIRNLAYTAAASWPS